MTTSGTTSSEPLIVAYQATNNVNGKRYIGITKVGLRQRKYRHLHCARNGKGWRLHDAIRKYGEDQFVWEVIKEFGSFDEAINFEIKAIAEFSPEYNVTHGGEGKRKPLSEETKAKMASARLGKPGTFTGRKHSEETRALMSAAKKGKPGPWSGKKRPEVTQWLTMNFEDRSRRWKGIPKPPEQIEKMRRTKTGVPRPELPDNVIDIFRENMRRAARARRKPVRCIEDGRIYASAVDAAKAYGFDRTAINAVASGRRRAVYGLHFEYEAA